MHVRPLILIPILLVVFLLGGCIALAVPIPAHEDPHFEEKIPTLRVGTTHKNYVIHKFGDPYEKYFEDSEFLYIAEGESWKIPWGIAVWPGAGGGGVVTLHKRHILLLSFDEKGVLSEIDVETAGDDFGDCTKSGICFGTGGG